ncbi:MAG: hypothetical protein HY721_16050, partial [Planctomycetes bacterium]|nr:hypothetical protein [Planctomycetota bacterium]
REAALDLGDLVPGLEGARDDRAEPPQALAAAAEDLQRGLTACEERLARRSRLWNHALPGVVALGWLWSLAYPVVRGAARRLAGEGDASWGSVAKDAFLGLLEGLNPAALASIAVLLVLAYLVSALAVWVRQVQRVEAAVTEAEDGYRRRVREHGEAAVARAREAAERWRAERRELEGLAGGQGDA